MLKSSYLFVAASFIILGINGRLPAQCPITVSAGPDQLVCNAGGSTELDGSISGTALGFIWTPATGLSSQTVLNPTATVSGAATYTLTAAAEDPSAPNLVTNPGFEALNTGFTSNYAYNPLPVTPGTYIITTSPALVLSTFPPCDDHTYGNGTGNMMLINGTGSASSSVWCQTIPVMANSWYILSAWIICSPISPPVMQFQVNGANAGDPYPVQSGVCNWQQFTATWFSGSATSANLCILDVSGSGNGFFGDDYALDDISMTKACTVTDQVTVSVANVNAVLPATVVLPCSAVNSGNGIVLNGSASSSGPGYTYSWSGPGIIGGDDTPNATVNEPGAYTLTVSYDTGNGICTDDATINVLPDPTVVNAFATANDDLTCINLTVGLSGAGSSTGPLVSYDWQPASGVVSGGGTLFPVVNQAGEYTLLVTNNTSGCTATATVTVNQYNAPAVAVAASPGSLSCINNLLTLNGAGSSTGGDYSYFWDGPGIVSGATTLNNCMIDAPGLYTLLVSNDLSGCTASASVTVGANNTPPVTVAAADAPGALNCQTTMLTLNSNGSSNGPNLNYLWTTANGTIAGAANGPNVQVTGAGVYILTITNTLNGCTASAQVNVNANTTPPVVLIEQPLPALNCAADSVQLDALQSSTGAGFSFTWSTGNGVLLSGANTGTPWLGSAGDYTLTITNAANGCTNSETVTVNWDTLAPVANVQQPAQLSCQTNQITLNGSGSSNGPSIGLNWNYSGNNPPGFVSGETTLTPTVNAPGAYILTVTDLNNFCTGSDTVVVGQDVGTPIANAGTAPVLDCVVQSAVLDGSGSSQGAGFTYFWSTGDTTLQTQVNFPGDYVLTVTNTTNGCSATDSVTVLLLGALPFITIDTPGVLTCAQTSLQITATASTGPEFAYLWSYAGAGQGILSGDSTLTPIAGSAGDYALTVTNTLTGCTSTDQVTVGQSILPPTAEAGPPQTLVCGSTGTLLDGTGSSTGPTVVYEWITADGNLVNGTTTLTPEVNAPGTYTLIATDTLNGCSSSDMVLINLDANAPVSDPGPAQSYTCLTTTITLDGTNSSTGPEYSYLWTSPNGTIDSGAGTLTPVVSAPGLYLLLVTNNTNNCQTLASVQVSDATIPPLAAATSPQGLSCATTQTTLSGSGSSSGAGFTYLWGGPGVVSGATTLTPLVNAPGVYTITVTDQGNGCTATSTTTLNSNTTAPLAAAASPQTLSCSVNQINLSGTGSSTGANFSYQWAGPGIVSGGNGLSPLVNAAGVYTLTVTDQSNGCSATAMATANANMVLPLAAAASPQMLTCSLGQINLSGTGSSVGPTISYQWTGPGIVSGGNGLSPLVNASGAYTLTVTDQSNGCTATATATAVSNTTPPLAAASAPQVLTCADVQVPLSGSGSSAGTNITYQWAGPGVVSGGNSLSPVVNATGTYSLTVTDQTNGCTAMSSTTLAENTTPPLAAAASPQMLTCTVAQITLSGTGSSTGPNISYQWAGPGIVSGGNSIMPVVNAPGVYTVTVTDQTNGCTNTAFTTAVSDGTSVSVSIAAPATLTCTVSQVTLNATASAGPGFTWQWTGPGVLSGGNTPNPVVDTPGQYVLIATNTQNGCTGTAQTTVPEFVVLPDVNAGPGFTLDCDSSSATLQGSSATPGAIFNWTTTDGNIVSGQTGANPVVDAAGIYTLVVTDPVSGCTAFETAHVAEAPVVFPVAEVVAPDCVHPTGSIGFSGGWGGQLPFVYSIDNGAHFVVDSVFGNLQSGNYQVLVQDAGGCVQTFALDLPAVTPVSVTLPATATVEAGQTYALEPVLNISPAALASVVWSPVSWLDCSDCLTPQSTPESDVVYEVLVTSNDGCTATASIALLVQVLTEVYVPNVFSPNDDGFNDLFQVSTPLQVSRFEMQLFDRWGNLVFAADDINSGWDGITRGKPQNPGVYVYWVRLAYLDADGKLVERLLDGDVLLVR